MPLDLIALFKQPLFVLAALLPIMNPPGLAPFFISLTDGASAATRTALARRVAVDVFALLVAGMFLGAYVLAAFEISLPVVKVAGGLMVMATAWKMLQSDDNSGGAAERSRAQTEWTPEMVAGRAFYPIAFPLTVGPGTLSVAITLGAGLPLTHWSAAPRVLASLVGCVLAAGVVYLCYRYAAKLVERLGSTGTIVLLRLSSFILLCVGVQILWDGLQAMPRVDLAP